MAGDKLNDSKAVVETGKAIPLPSPVRDTHKALSNKIYRSVMIIVVREEGLVM